MLTSSDNLTIREATPNDIHLIHQLAHAIWPVTYSTILSADQLRYMLELIYSETSLQKQFKEGHHFIIVEDDNKSIAFADYSLLHDAIYKLHKIYVLPEEQGKGIGKILIDYIIQKIKQQQAIALRLNVNRNNNAKKMYEHLGFKVLYEEEIDIGDGYFMNDYIMQLNL